ncbi:EAL domain-containing protein [Hyphomicrobium sp.]|uniref:EAL domain-containing protein n=1 Tax=Hyphomicrobium sp. TaxID=82 RepID=UPI001D7D2E29|nr:EAL domain-containing protein [Hyphomicrobium sp.]MBY0561692.1 EAL domain-containing protein [Hyphomicrobium sp.]
MVGPANGPTNGLANSPAEPSIGPATGQAADAPREPRSRDGLIVASILIVSAAITMMCFSQLGLSMPISIATGVVALSLLMLIHKQVQKSAQIALLKAELARAEFAQARLDVKPNGAKQKISSARPAPAVAAPGPSLPSAPNAPSAVNVPAASSTPESRIRELSRDIGNLVPRSEPAAPAQPAGAPQPPHGTAGLSSARPLASVDADRAGRSAPHAPMQSAAEPVSAKPTAEPKGRPVFAAPASERPVPETGRERWSFRRRVDVQPQQPPVKGVTPPPGWSASANVPKGDVAMTIEGDLELVQRKIKELADEVNAAEALRAPKSSRAHELPKPSASALEDSIGALRAVATSMRQRPAGFGDFLPTLDAAKPASKSASAPASLPAPSMSPGAPPMQAAAPAPVSPPAEPVQSQGLGELVIPATAERIAGFEPEDSVDDATFREEEADAELGRHEPNLSGMSLAEMERANPGSIQREASPLPELTLPELPILEFSAEPASTPELPPRVASIARAIEEDAIDVTLGPIVTIAEHSVSHYEMTANLRSASGEPHDASEQDFSLVGGDLDTRFDISRLNRAAALASRMDARDRAGSLLTSFLGSSVTSRTFLESFAHAYEVRPRISAQLVLTFSQRSIDEFTPAAWQALRDMHSFGFRLALDQVTHMGTDFAALQQAGFRFVRFGAQPLLEGMTSRDRFVPADEILQRVTLAGLSVIASGITDAAMQKRLLDAGILLGQGPLFGAPRQVNIDGSRPAKHSAAA